MYISPDLQLEKRACGYGYVEQAKLLARFDRALSSELVTSTTLPRTATQQWLAKRPHESIGTHQHRISIVRQFAQFMCRSGHLAAVPARWPTLRDTRNFVPYIFTRAEITALFEKVDQLAPTAHAPTRHLIMPEVFRLLYGCDFRVNEVLQLRVADVDLDRGVVTVREGKFCKDRLIPPTIALVRRLRRYATDYGKRPAGAFFFPAPQGGAWHHSPDTDAHDCAKDPNWCRQSVGK